MERMRRIALDSRSIAVIGYAASQRVLEIEFRNGHVYHYFDVPRKRMPRSSRRSPRALI